MTPPVVSFIGKSGAGKTTLLIRLIPLLKQKGLRVGSVKRSHHKIEIDHKGKDSFRMREAGADPVILTGGTRLAFMTDSCESTRLTDLLDQFSSRADLVLVEGFKQEDVPAVAVIRKENGYDPDLLKKENLIALVTDIDLPTDLPKFSFEDETRLVELIMKHTG